MKSSLRVCSLWQYYCRKKNYCGIHVTERHVAGKKNAVWPTRNSVNKSKLATQCFPSTFYTHFKKLQNTTILCSQIHACLWKYLKHTGKIHAKFTMVVAWLWDTERELAGDGVGGTKETSILLQLMYFFFFLLNKMKQMGHNINNHQFWVVGTPVSILLFSILSGHFF